jgi:hypothetical protein
MMANDSYKDDNVSFGLAMVYLADISRDIPGDDSRMSLPEAMARLTA